MSTEKLYHLVYVSRNEIEGSSEDVYKEIDNILTTARENNAQKEITGALLFNDGCFAQVLEGPQEEVEDLFEDIQGDSRHSNAMVLSCKAISKRSFSDWSMAYRGSDSDAKRRFSQLMKNQEVDNTEISGDSIFSLLVEHVNEQENRV